LTTAATPAARVWARLRRHPSARVGGVLLLVLVAFAVLGPLLAASDPLTSDFVHGATADGLPRPPGAGHWLGTDSVFRDVFSRLAHGGRLSLLVAVLATFLSTVIGATVGIVAGTFAGTRHGFIDAILMRFVDVLLSFPYLLLVMAIGAAVEAASVGTVLLVLGLTSWLSTARILRAKTMQLRELAYVEAARALGQHTPVIWLRHILPNVAGPLIVVSTSSMASMILAESVLSYLSVGVQPPTATWGRMLAEGQRTFTAAPHLVIAPAAAILVSVLAFNLVGEGVRDALDTRDARG
jgi:ABC-type dipeptide/oligopeptide/nickel transport system permease subunit